MELKVWVEGIQRVVCGVSESTTCQDVVYALAHATGQTGRFTLVERWRHNERLLPPQEYPLKVLNKWGEYANDVQFILRRSHSDKKKSSQGGNNAVTNAIPPVNPNISNNKRHHELRSFSPTSPTNTPSASSHHNKLEIKKSLTFSGSHGGGSSGESGHSTPSNLPPTLSSPKSEPLPPGSHKSRSDVPKGVVKGVQQQKSTSDHHQLSHDSPTKSKSERPKQPPSYDEAVSRSSRQAQSSQMHPSPPIVSSPIPPVTSVGSEKDSPTSKRRHVAQSNHPSQSPSRNQQNRTGMGERVSREQIGKRESPVASLSPVRTHDQHKQWSNVSTEPANNSSKNSKSRKNLDAAFDQEDNKQDQKENQNIEEIGPQDPQFRDLIRLVNLQREKLNSQHAELSQYDSEIVYWESKLQEQEDRLASVEEELHLLEKKNAELEDELRQLEDHQPLFLEAIERGRQDDRSLRSKLSVIRAQLANCETEALQCRQKMRQLLEELAEERRRGVAEREEQEQEAKRQLQDLNEELVKHTDESEKQKTTLDKLEEELKQLENQMNEKKMDVDKVTEEMREANLQSLSMTISEDIKLVAEGNFGNRSGSMRRIMGSPRQLENAVPTSKNPHGVWV